MVIQWADNQIYQGNLVLNEISRNGSSTQNNFEPIYNFLLTRKTFWSNVFKLATIINY